MIGLQAAQRALTDWASGATGVRLAGIVLVADAPGRLPRALSDVVATIEGTAPGVWRLPWCQAWRLAERPSLRTADRKFIGAIGSMAEALNMSLADT